MHKSDSLSLFTGKKSRIQDKHTNVKMTPLSRQTLVQVTSFCANILKFCSKIS